MASQGADRLHIHDPILDVTLPETAAVAAMATGANRQAAEDAGRAAEIARSAGLLGWLASSLSTAANGHALAGDLDRARPFAVEGLDVARQVGRPDLIAGSLNALSSALAGQDPAQARTLLRESVALISTFGGRRGDFEFSKVVFTAAGIGDWELVLEVASPAVRYYHWQSMLTVLGGALATVSRAIAAGDSDTSARLQGAARRLMTPSNPPASNAANPTGGPHTGGSPAAAASGEAGLVANLYRQTSAILSDALGEDRLRELRTEGAALDNDHAVALALDAIVRAQAPRRP
jgi:hypothetical protein